MAKQRKRVAWLDVPVSKAAIETMPDDLVNEKLPPHHRNAALFPKVAPPRRWREIFLDDCDRHDENKPLTIAEHGGTPDKQCSEISTADPEAAVDVDNATKTPDPTEKEPAISTDDKADTHIVMKETDEGDANITERPKNKAQVEVNSCQGKYRVVQFHISCMVKEVPLPSFRFSFAAD